MTLEVMKYTPVNELTLKVSFRINTPGMYSYVPDYCAYSIDGESTWYKMVPDLSKPHSTSPLFVPDGGAVFNYYMESPYAQGVSNAPFKFPKDLSVRISTIDIQCVQAPPGTPVYTAPTGQPPIGSGPALPPNPNNPNPNPTPPLPPGGVNPPGNNPQPGDPGGGIPGEPPPPPPPPGGTPTPNPIEDTTGGGNRGDVPDPPAPPDPPGQVPTPPPEEVDGPGKTPGEVPPSATEPPTGTPTEEPNDRPDGYPPTTSQPPPLDPSPGGGGSTAPYGGSFEPLDTTDRTDPNGSLPIRTNTTWPGIEPGEVVSAITPGGIVPGGTSSAAPHESEVGITTPQPHYDPGAFGVPLEEITTTAVSGVVLELHVMPSTISYYDQSGLAVVIQNNTGTDLSVALALDVTYRGVSNLDENRPICLAGTGIVTIPTGGEQAIATVMPGSMIGRAGYFTISGYAVSSDGTVLIGAKKDLVVGNG